MIIYLVEPGLNSQPLSLLASFKDFFLVVQFPNFLTTPTGKKPELHLILWVTTLIKYQITEQTMRKHWFVYKAASMIPQHPALFPSWQPTSSAREPGAPERIQISAYTNWLFQSLESLIIFQITPWSIEAYFFLPGLSAFHKIPPILLPTASEQSFHLGWLFWAHQMAHCSFHGGIITCTCPEEIILRAGLLKNFL